MIFLDKNGVTIKANQDAIIGECYFLNGIEYRVVKDFKEIKSILKAGGDLSKIVTSFVTELSFLPNLIRENFNHDILKELKILIKTLKIGMFLKLEQCKICLREQFPSINPLEIGMLAM
jgi:hypothetical protein